MRRRLTSVLSDAVSRMVNFGNLGPTPPAKVRWMALGLMRNRLQQRVWSRLLTGEFRFMLGRYGPRVLKVRFRDFDDLIIFEEIFFRKQYPLDEIGFVPDLIVDCGAHVGFFALLAASAFPDVRVLCLEPNPRNFSALQAHVSANKTGAEILPVAADTESGWISFSGEGFRGAVVPECTEESIRVRSVGLNDLIVGRCPKRLVVKLDVEGAEHRLLPGLLAIMPPEAALFFEWHGGSDSWRQALASLEAAGFKVEVVLDLTESAQDVGVAAAVRNGR